MATKAVQKLLAPQKMIYVQEMEVFGVRCVWCSSWFHNWDSDSKRSTKHFAGLIG
jgi:hypothetical protein